MACTCIDSSRSAFWSSRLSYVSSKRGVIAPIIGTAHTYIICGPVAGSGERVSQLTTIRTYAIARPVNEDTMSSGGVMFTHPTHIFCFGLRDQWNSLNWKLSAHTPATSFVPHIPLMAVPSMVARGMASGVRHRDQLELFPGQPHWRIRPVLHSGHRATILPGLFSLCMLRL